MCQNYNNENLLAEPRMRKVDGKVVRLPKQKENSKYLKMDFSFLLANTCTHIHIIRRR
jgi:hypothetical protein